MTQEFDSIHVYISSSHLNRGQENGKPGNGWGAVIVPYKSGTPLHATPISGIAPCSDNDHSAEYAALKGLEQAMAMGEMDVHITLHTDQPQLKERLKRAEEMQERHPDLVKIVDISRFINLKFDHTSVPRKNLTSLTSHEEMMNKAHAIAKASALKDRFGKQHYLGVGDRVLEGDDAKRLIEKTGGWTRNV